MHSIVVKQWGETPQYVEVDEPASPAADSDLVKLTVKATGLHQLVKGRAAGTHYSAKTLPHTLGVDGVGTAQDGKDYYFSVLGAPPGTSTGSYSSVVVVPRAAAVPLPEGADPVLVAALVNPGMSSWMALRLRVGPLPKDFTAVILNATSVSGRLAVPIARHLGAAKIIGIARNPSALADIPGLDLRVPLDKADPGSTDFSEVAKWGADVVLDYLWGPAAVALLRALKPTTARPLQYVQVGNMSGATTDFPADLLRSSDLTMRGTGPGSWSPQQFAGEQPELIRQVSEVGGGIPLKVLKLEDVKEGWTSKERVVFTL